MTIGAHPGMQGETGKGKTHLGLMMPALGPC
jgi:hypothetical protein